MDTIIYLKMDKRNRQRGRELPVFHITRLRGEELAGALQGHLDHAWESIQLLYVTIPWNIDSRYLNWPAELSRYLIPFFGYSSSVETVCDFTVERWLKEKALMDRWAEVWGYPAYTDFHRKVYADVLLCRAMSQTATQQWDFHVIGYEEFVPQVLAPYMKKIRTLTFLVEGAPPGQLESYLQELGEEEGLAADLRVLEKEAGYRRFRPECDDRSVVLDFSGEEKIAPSGGSKGVVWIDMDSLESKKKKIMVNCAETAYFSMKEEWGRLDTVGKNGYNT